MCNRGRKHVYRATIGDKIYELRNIRGITQLQMAIDSGLSLHAVRQIECGQRKNITVLTALRICTVLRCTINQLIDYESANCPLMVRLCNCKAPCKLHSSHRKPSCTLQ